MILKLSELRVVAFAQFAKKIQKIIVTWWILSTKTYFSQRITSWLSLYPSLSRMLETYPASHSYFLSIDKPTVVLKRFLEIL